MAIDNLRIFTGSSPQDSFRIISIERVAGATPDTVEITITWTSSDRKTYGVFGPPGLDKLQELDERIAGCQRGSGISSLEET